MLIGETSDLDRLQYGGANILPEKESYTVTTPDGSVVSSVPGGLPKSQMQFFNQPYEVSVSYVSLSAFKASYIENFFTLHNGQSFIVSLLIGGTEIEEFVVKYIGSTEHSKTGFNGSMSVKYSVEPAIDVCFQQVVIDWGGCRGDDTCAIWNIANAGIRALP